MCRGELGRCAIALAFIIAAPAAADAQEVQPTRGLRVVVTTAPDRERDLFNAEYVSIANAELSLEPIARSVLAHCGFGPAAGGSVATLTIRAKANAIGGQYGDTLTAYTGADIDGTVSLAPTEGAVLAAAFSAVRYPTLLFPAAAGAGVDVRVPRAATVDPVLYGGVKRTRVTSTVGSRPLLEGKVFVDALLDVVHEACGTAGLARAASDSVPSLRAAAIYALASRSVGQPDAREALLAKLNDPDPAVHGAVAQALSDADATAAAEPLRRHLASKPLHYEARGSLERAIAHLTNTPLESHTWQSLARWHLIVWDTSSKDDVRELLGEPETIGDDGKWRYGSGWVAFSRPENGETVTLIRYPRH